MSDNTKLPELQCEVCKKEPAVGVASVPGIPYSAAYGRECLNKGADPYGIVRANIACCGGPDHIAQWVLDTMTYLDDQYMTMREALAKYPMTAEETDFGEDEIGGREAMDEHYQSMVKQAEELVAKTTQEETVEISVGLFTQIVTSLKNAVVDGWCDACGGAGVPTSGKPCMCGGTGKASDAVIYLRTALFDSERFEEDKLKAIDFIFRLAYGSEKAPERHPGIPTGMYVGVASAATGYAEELMKSGWRWDAEKTPTVWNIHDLSKEQNAAETNNSTQGN